MEANKKFEKEFFIYQNKGVELKRDGIKWLIEYLKEQPTQSHSFDNSDDYEASPVYVYVETGTHGDIESFRLEAVDYIGLGSNDQLYVHTKSGHTEVEWFTPSDIYDLYDRVLCDEDIKKYGHIIHNETK